MRQRFNGGPIVLAGSGEYSPVMNEMDAEVLASVAALGDQVALLPTAAGLEDPDYWIELGMRHFAALGAHPFGLPAYTRTHADDAELAQQLSEASFIYYSGGKPDYIVQTLRDSRLWTATLERWRQGAALGGCSAGVMMLGGVSYSPLAMLNGDPFTIYPALGLFPNWFFIPHFNNPLMLVGHDLATLREQIAPEYALIGIDEDSALLYNNGEWSVWGAGGVSVIPFDGATIRYKSGDSKIILPDSGWGHEIKKSW